MIKNCDKTDAGILPEENEILEKPQNICPVQWAKDVAKSANAASCGKGTVCRDGLHQLWLIMDGITNNKGTREDIEMLTDLVSSGLILADCELSHTALRLIQTSMNTHADEWTAHVARRRCPAGACAAFPAATPAAPESGLVRRRRRPGGGE